MGLIVLQEGHLFQNLPGRSLLAGFLLYTGIFLTSTPVFVSIALANKLSITVISPLFSKNLFEKGIKC